MAQLLFVLYYEIGIFFLVENIVSALEIISKMEQKINRNILLYFLS